MNRSAIFYGAIIVAVLAVILSVYYIVPGYYHILTTHDYNSGHPTHAVAFAVVAVICIIAALIYRPRSVVR